MLLRMRTQKLLFLNKPECEKCHRELTEGTNNCIFFEKTVSKFLKSGNISTFASTENLALLYVSY